MSPFVWFYESICIAVILRHAFATSIIFGFHTPKDHGSDSVVTLTLFWDGFKYQCNVYPTEYNTYYSCNSSNIATTLQCDQSLTDSLFHHHLQIDNNDWDDLKIQSVSIKIIEYSAQITRNISIYFCMHRLANQTTNHLSTYCNHSPQKLDNVTISTGFLIPLISSASSNTESYLQILSQSARCVPNDLPSAQTIGKYILVPIQKTWLEAQTHCKDEFNSDLATLISDQDVTIAVAIRDSNDEYFDRGIWIGLTDNALLSNEGEWKWIDMTPCDYTHTGLCRDDVHWGPNEPNEDEEEDCAEIGHQYTFGLFNDISCTEKRIFLCNNVSFVPTITTQIPQWTIASGGNLDPQHDSLNLMVVYIGIGAFVLTVIVCICFCFYGKKWVKEQIRIETLKQRQSDMNCVNDVKANKRRNTFTLEPGQRVQSHMSQDGYIGVNKNSGDDDEKEITVDDTLHIAVEGYVKENQNDDEDVNKVLIPNVPQISPMIYINESDNSSSSDSDDLYVNPNPENDTETPTANQIGMTQGGTFVNLKDSSVTNDGNTRGIDDPNTKGVNS